MRKRVLLSASIAAALLLASIAALGVPNEQARAAFPGINGKIVFIRWGVNGGIFTTNFTGNNLKRLASNSSKIHNARPSWSPNGKKIAFTRTAGARRNTDIYIMNADGSNKKLVTNERLIPGDIREDGHPAFSPSGRKIVFWRGPDLYTINVDGTNLTQITSDGRKTLEGSPVWSPDGTKIAYEGDMEIVVMNSDGSSPTEIPDRLGGSPDWSPDGTKIVYGCGRYGVMNADGSERTILGGNIGFRSTCYTDIESSAFAPGGGKIVFSAERDGDFDLYIINADRSGLRHLTNLPGREGGPDWQPVQ